VKRLRRKLNIKKSARRTTKLSENQTKARKASFSARARAGRFKDVPTLSRSEEIELITRHIETKGVILCGEVDWSKSGPRYTALCKSRMQT
jgi:hypothetical protein